VSQPHPQSVARILAGPWHQRRNAGSLWGVALVIALCFAAPVGLLAWHWLFAAGRPDDPLLQGALRSFWIGVAALLVAGWAMLVGNVLQQNHPTIARLVPHHASQLRLALLVAWALASLAAAALPGFAFDAPLAWACGVAAALALLAACLRWPPLLLGGIASPFVVGWVTKRYGPETFMDAVWQQWADHRALATGIVVTAGAAILVATVRGGDARHMAAYESRQRLRQGALPQRPGDGRVSVCSRVGWIGELAVDGRPYRWWMASLLARPDSSVMSRLLLGLGPAAHWTTRIFQAFWYVVISTGLCLLVSLFVADGMLAYFLPWLAFSVLTGLCTPALQAAAQLRRTQREQGILALLPGVPRGARLNRWLAWQMSASFLVAALCAFALAMILNAVADTLKPGVSLDATGGISLALAAVLLPQVAWQWRRWARLRGATGGAAQLPAIVPILMGGAAMALHGVASVGYLAEGVVLALLSAAYCAWRWARMGSEPTAFPVGRLS
jgi:hypothetical protein